MDYCRCRCCLCQHVVCVNIGVENIAVTDIMRSPVWTTVGVVVVCVNIGVDGYQHRCQHRCGSLSQIS